MKNIVIILILFIYACGNPAPKQSQQKMSATLATPLVRNLLYEESYENSRYCLKSGTAINVLHSLENCNNDDTAHGTKYDHELKRVSDTVYQGGKAIRIEILSTDPPNHSAGRIHSEMTIIKGSEDSRFTNEMWYSFDIYFPAYGSINDVSHETINQWFEDGGDDCTIKVRSGKAYLEKPQGSGLNQYDLFGAPNAAPASGTSVVEKTFTPIPRDSWHEFVFHYIHSLGSDGLIEIWRDGVKIQIINGTNMHSSVKPKWKIGIYKSDWTQNIGKSTTTDRVLFYDNIRVGDRTAKYSDMASGTDTVVTPPPPPANKVPNANAGSDQTITLPVSYVNFSGAADDSDGTIVRVQWAKISGADGVIIAGPNTLTPTVSNLVEGAYTFRLIATDNNGATANDDVSVIVKAAIPPPPPTSSATVTGFTLVNSSTEKDIQNITDGQVISISATKSTKFNIRGNTTNTTSVKFELSGKQTKIYTDDKIPFALMGDNGSGNYYYGNWNPPALGTYTLKATPYDAAGKAGTSKTITFTFVK